MAEPWSWEADFEEDQEAGDPGVQSFGAGMTAPAVEELGPLQSLIVTDTESYQAATAAPPASSGAAAPAAPAAGADEDAWQWDLRQVEQRLLQMGWNSENAKKLLGHSLGEVRLPEAKLHEAPKSNRTAPAAPAVRQGWVNHLPMPRVAVVGSN